MTDLLYSEWDTFGVLGIAGKTGTGKSSTLRLILAQLAMGEHGIIVADGHGKMQGSLVQSIDAISPALIIPPVVEFNDILQAINAVQSIMVDRKEKRDLSTSKIAFVIDEFTSFFMQMNKDQINNVAKMLLSLGNEARKTNIRVFLAAHNWSQDYIGAAAVRRSLGGMIFHRLDEGEAKLFIESNAKLRNTIANLKKGEALLRLPTHDPVKVMLPYVAIDDLDTIVQDVYHADELRALYGHKFSIRKEITMENKQLNSDEIIDKIIELRMFEGMSKQNIIWQVFHVRAGSSPKYKAASKLFDAIMKKVSENIA